mgnify:CR=1 FL=1
MKAQIALSMFIGAALVVAGVLFFLAATTGESDAEEPWIVTAIRSEGTDQSPRLVIEYTAFAGVTTWERTVAGSSSTVANAVVTCWTSARVGSPLPDCARKAQLTVP